VGYELLATSYEPRAASYDLVSIKVGVRGFFELEEPVRGCASSRLAAATKVSREPASYKNPCRF
jgi:hypothetical protein